MTDLRPFTRCLLQDRITVTGEGMSDAQALPDGRWVIITLGSHAVLDQQSLEVFIIGSRDGETWDKRPLLSFPQRFYSGASALVLDRKRHPEVGLIRAQWKANRWGRGETKPHFEIWLTCESLSG